MMAVSVSPFIVRGLRQVYVTVPLVQKAEVPLLKNVIGILRKISEILKVIIYWRQRYGYRAVRPANMP